MNLSMTVTRSENIRRMVRRMLGAARLNGETFRSLMEDSDATGQSLIVLVIAGLSFGLGYAVALGADLSGTLLGGAVGVAASVTLGFVWLSLTYFVGTRLLRGNASYWGLARPLFFSTSPGIVFLLTLVPTVPVQETFRAVGLAWIAIASVYAVKNVFGFDSSRSFMAFVIVAFILLISYGLIVSI